MLAWLRSLFRRKGADMIRAGPWCRCTSCGNKWQSAALLDPESGTFEDIVPVRCWKCGQVGCVEELKFKPCSRCAKVLPLDYFALEPNEPDGHGSACPACLFGGGRRS